MNKSELIQAVADRSGLTKKDSSRAVEEMLGNEWWWFCYI